ncbi:MAG: nickel pincer cofactor biosynthesis protein LarC [Desulfosudaceae bacterium]
MVDIYFDCGAGISGDMTLAALIDLGLPEDWLRRQIAALPLTGFELGVSSVFRNRIAARRVEVVVADDSPARDYAAIKKIISDSPLPDRARQISLAIFEKLARAEAGIHGCDPERVHFHELGGVDAIVDVVGAALGVTYLEVNRVVASALPLGRGLVQCAHGTLPVPAPATVAILKNVPVYGAGVNRELVTPTGAAIITTLADSFGRLPAMRLDKSGYGAGTHESEGLSNVLRLISGEFQDQPDAAGPETVLMLETCLDDMSPEICGYVMEKLFAAGALDVYWVPIFMKKNRPATMLQVLCRRQDSEKLMTCILSQTSTIGVRYYPVRRRALDRREVTVRTGFGPVRAKQITTPSGDFRVTPEYEACREVAEREKVPILKVYQAVAGGDPESSDSK